MTTPTTPTTTRFEPPEDWVNYWLWTLDLDLKPRENDTYEIVNAEGHGLGARSYSECLTQLQSLIDEHRACPNPT